jgi:hypothetical protein
MSNLHLSVSEPTFRVLCELSNQLGEPMESILDRAVEDYRRKQLLEQANAGYTALRNNPDEWQEEQRERDAWDAH